MLQRLLRGNELRISRFHDEKGNLIPASGLIWAPFALASAVLKHVGCRFAVPMISYRARRAILAHLAPGRTVVEFGSGYSTPWLARRCGFLISREDDAAWHGKVTMLLQQRQIRNVRHELRTGAAYHDLGEVADGSVNFALIDGSDRPACIASVIPKLAPGAALYLDNSDKDMTTGGSLRRAEALLLDFAGKRGARVTCFTDFSPTNFFVEQGILVELPPFPSHARQPSA